MNKLISIAMTALLFLSPLAARAAGKAEVVDNASFFSADAITQANQKLADIEQKYSLQMRVETYPQIPDEMRAQYSDANKRAFFQRWARQRAEQSGIRGVFVLICKSPSSLQVEVGDDTLRSGAFRQSDRMSSILISAFKQKNYDQGLNDAIELWRSSLAAHAGQSNESSAAGSSGANGSPPVSSPQASSAPPPSSPPPAYSFPSGPNPMPRSGGFPWGGIIFIGIIAIIGISILRRLFGGARSASNYGSGVPFQGGYGGGGGGFGTGFLGGLLGGWVGNRMSSHQNYGSSAPPPPQDSSGGGIFHESSGSSFGGGETFSGGGGGSSGGDFGGGGGGGGGDSGGSSGGSSGGDF